MDESLDSRQLKAFVVLTKTGSYTETAKQLYLTHSAISHSMRALEAQVGCRLLSKLNKKVMLTEAGEALLHHAVRVLEEMSHARRTLSELNKWGSRRLHLAADTIFLSDFLAPVLIRFHKEFPRVMLQVESCGANESASLLEKNRADILLVEKPPANDAIEFVPLLADRYHIVVNSAHPLAAKKNVARDEFGNYPALLLRGSRHGRERLENFLRQREIALNPVGEIENVDAIKDFVKHTLTISILPGWIVGTEIKNRTFTAIPLGRTPFEQTWGFAYSSGRPLNHAESTLLKLSRQRVAHLGSTVGF